jgi:hypothetical protein
MFITESNLSSSASETYMDLFSGLWLADYIGSFLTAGGQGVYFFHYLPLPMEHGCNDSPGTFGMFTVDKNYAIQQPLPQFYVAQLLNREWLQPGNSEHVLFAARSDVDDGAGHSLVAAYAAKRPDGQWSLLVVNRDQFNAHKLRIAFDNGGSSTGFVGTAELSSFGRAQYQWHPDLTKFLAHAETSGDYSVITTSMGHAEPDEPPVKTSIDADANTEFTLPAASVTVIRGTVR